MRVRMNVCIHAHIYIYIYIERERVVFQSRVAFMCAKPYLICGLKPYFAPKSKTIPLLWSRRFAPMAPGHRFRHDCVRTPIPGAVIVALGMKSGSLSIDGARTPFPGTIIVALDTENRSFGTGGAGVAILLLYYYT